MAFSRHRDNRRHSIGCCTRLRRRRIAHRKVGHPDRNHGDTCRNPRRRSKVCPGMRRSSCERFLHSCNMEVGFKSKIQNNTFLSV